MGIDLHWVSGSPFSWRVQLALEVKALAYHSHLLQMSRGEHRTPAFLAMNPRGQVPVLRDGDDVVCESIAILAYLDRRYPTPPLFGETPAETGRVWQAVQECSLHLDAAGDQFILPFYFDRSVEQEGQIRAALPQVDAELSRWERALEAAPYLALPHLSAADITLYPMVKSVLRAVSKPEAARFDHGFLPFERRFPRLQAWMSRIEALPGYERTYPPHWRNG